MDDKIETNADSNPNPNQQMNLFSGEQLRDRGIKMAVDHANAVVESWSDIAYRFLLNYNPGVPFMGEDVRNASFGIVPEPPDLRAWGGTLRRAATAGIITRVGYGNVKNPKAHAHPTTIWKKTNRS